MFDVLIRGGMIIDGTGRSRFGADIGIKDGVISEIGTLHGERAKETIDASGKIVAPGFIDACNHSDAYWTLFTDPLQESLVRQGITTIMGGNCGSSLAPLLSDDAILSIQKWASPHRLNTDWHTLEEFLATLSRKKLGVNFGTLIGHGTLRRALVHDESRVLQPEEERIMESAIRDAMEQGAFGLSTGLAFAHASTAQREEVYMMAKIVSKFSGVYTTHIRNEMGMFRDAVREAIQVASETGVRTHISHLKVLGNIYWEMFEEVLQEMQESSRVGYEVTFDLFPYTATGSVLYTLLPEWAFRGGKKMMLSRIRDKNTRRDIVQDVRRKQLNYSKIRVSLANSGSHRTLEEMSEKQGVDPEEVILNLLVANDGRVIVFLDLISEENICKGLRSQFSIISSDGVGYDGAHKESGERIHPRSFGAFPRVLGHYVREKNVLTWEECVYKMTGFPARIFGIRSRGELRVGYAADVVLFDPDTVSDEATFDDPYRYPKGIECVIINGNRALLNGSGTCEGFGKVLRR